MQIRIKICFLASLDYQDFFFFFHQSTGIIILKNGKWQLKFPNSSEVRKSSDCYGCQWYVFSLFGYLTKHFTSLFLSLTFLVFFFFCLSRFLETAEVCIGWISQMYIIFALIKKYNMYFLVVWKKNPFPDTIKPSDPPSFIILFLFIHYFWLFSIFILRLFH